MCVLDTNIKNVSLLTGHAGKGDSVLQKCVDCTLLLIGMILYVWYIPTVHGAVPVHANKLYMDLYLRICTYTLEEHILDETPNKLDDTPSN